jgi:hypothetical protein
MEHPNSVATDTQLPPHKERTEHELPAPTHRPASGRATPMGRKVEKPRDASPPGPSGQLDHTQHERKHTNK